MATETSSLLAAQPPLPDLAVAYRELQHLLITTSEIDEFLAKLASLAVEVISPVSSCAIMMRSDGKPMTVTASDAQAREVDELQYGRGVGPGLQAVHTGEIVTVANLAEEQRWGDYPVHALGYGVAASLSLPLTAGKPTVGAINLYSVNPHEFTAAEVAQGVAFAAQASGALALLLRHEALLQVNAQLQEALASRAVIDQAMGVLMGTRHISATAAFDTLRGHSQRRNVKLHAIAAELVETITNHVPQQAPPFTKRG